MASSLSLSVFAPFVSSIPLILTSAVASGFRNFWIFRLGSFRGSPAFPSADRPGQVTLTNYFFGRRRCGRVRVPQGIFLGDVAAFDPRSWEVQFEELLAHDSSSLE